MTSAEQPATSSARLRNFSEGRARISAWVVYGMGGAGYLLMVPTIGYAAYFHAEVTRGRADADLLWAGAVAAALVIAGIAAPFLGAYADRSAAKRPILALLTVLACIATAALSLVGRGDVLAGALFFVAAHVAFMLAKAIYDSYLPLLAAPPSMPVVSGVGWGLSYLGSLACFFLCLPLIAGGSETSNPQTFRIAFLVTAVFFACLAVPAILWLPADARPPTLHGSAFGRICETVLGWREHRETFKFLLAFYLINDAVVTVLFFIGVFFKTNYLLTVEEILRYTLLFYAVGIPATVGFGWLGKVWSERAALNLTLAIWLLLLAMMALGEGEAMPLAVALVAGLVIGSSQALCRSIYARMIPPARTAEFFGFNALVGRASAVLGPLAFGIVSSQTGSQRAAMASLSVFILLGAAVFACVRLPRDEE